MLWGKTMTEEERAAAKMQAQAEGAGEGTGFHDKDAEISQLREEVGRLRKERDAARDLLWQFESVLTEMRTYGKAHPTIAGWVRRLDSERDYYKRETGRDEYVDQVNEARAALDGKVE